MGFLLCQCSRQACLVDAYLFGFHREFCDATSTLSHVNTLDSTHAQAYPLARGHVHITHANDVSTPVNFAPGYFETRADVRPLTWAYKFTREIARRMPHFRGEPHMVHPAFAPGGPASTIDPSHSIRRVSYILRTTSEHLMHSHTPTLGTCAMKPRELGGIVDARLNVYGVRGLKVADLSIAPSNVSATTYGTALVIGEKTAVIIANELGIQGVV